MWKSTFSKNAKLKTKRKSKWNRKYITGEHSAETELANPANVRQENDTETYQTIEKSMESLMKIGKMEKWTNPPERIT